MSINFNRARNVWEARHSLDGKRYYLGAHPTEQAASEAVIGFIRKAQRLSAPIAMRYEKTPVTRRRQAITQLEALILRIKRKLKKLRG